MAATVQLYYDFSSPNAYFTFVQLPPIAEKHGATIEYKPFLLGAVFKSLGTGMTPGMANPLKAHHNQRDMIRWAEKYSIPFRPPSRFPMNTVKALRLALAIAADGKDHRAFADSVFRAYWAEDRDISDDAVLSELLSAQGLDAAAYLARTQDPAVKEQLRAATSEAEERGVFGAPVCIVGDEVFWGKDRLDFVEDALQKA